MAPASLANLTPGNPGNKGGGLPYEQREAKEAFLLAIQRKEYTDKEGNVKFVGDGLKDTIAANLVNPDPKFQMTRIWVGEMIHGKPNSITSVVVSEGNIDDALAFALHDPEIDEEVAKRVLTRFREFLVENAG